MCAYLTRIKRGLIEVGYVQESIQAPGRSRGAGAFLFEQRRAPLCFATALRNRNAAGPIHLGWRTGLPLGNSTRDDLFGIG